MHRVPFYSSACINIALVFCGLCWEIFQTGVVHMMPLSRLFFKVSIRLSVANVGVELILSS